MPSDKVKIRFKLAIQINAHTAIEIETTVTFDMQ
jgi:hypothetical protein